MSLSSLTTGAVQALGIKLTGGALDTHEERVLRLRRNAIGCWVFRFLMSMALCELWGPEGSVLRKGDMEIDARLLSARTPWVKFTTRIRGNSCRFARCNWQR